MDRLCLRILYIVFFISIYFFTATFAVWADEIEWSISDARQIIIDNHYTKPRSAEVPQTSALLVDWLESNDNHASLTPMRTKFKDSLGLLFIESINGDIAVPLVGGSIWSSGLTSAIKVINKSYLLQNDRLIGTRLDNGKYIDRQIERTNLARGLVELIDISSVNTVRITGFEQGQTLRSAKQLITYTRFRPQHISSNKSVTSTQADFKTLENQDSVLLDLRYCAGGDVYEATDFAGMWIKNRVPWVTIDYARKTGITLETGGRDIFNTQLRGILVSEFTASSCEQLVEGLKHYLDVPILGRRTAGKCSVQSTYPLVGKYWLKITTGEWKGPASRRCSELGLSPDIRYSGNIHSNKEISAWLKEVLE